MQHPGLEYGDSFVLVYLVFGILCVPSMVHGKLRQTLWFLFGVADLCRLLHEPKERI